MLLALTLSGCKNSTEAPQEKTSGKDYQVAAYYWPAYHHEALMNELYRGNIGEWEIIKSSTPQYDAHRKPVFNIYQLTTLIVGLGGKENTIDAAEIVFKDNTYKRTNTYPKRGKTRNVVLENCLDCKIEEPRILQYSLKNNNGKLLISKKISLYLS